MMKIIQGAGYSGWVGIEYEGTRLSEFEGIQAARRLLGQCLQRATLPMERARLFDQRDNPATERIREVQELDRVAALKAHGAGD